MDILLFAVVASELAVVRIAMVFSPSMSWKPERIRNDPERTEQTVNSESAHLLRFVQLRLVTWLKDRSSP